MNASNSAEIERREVRYSGRVQGVGFRVTARQIAQRFVVTGFVRNLSNGQVHLVVEGHGSVIDAFLAAVAEELDRHIEQATVEVAPSTGEFATFEIRR